MAKDKLFVDDADDYYRLTWWVEEDVGGTLGDGDRAYTEADLNSADASARDHIIACMAAAKTSNVKRDHHGFYWDSRSKATAALRVINLAIKNDGGTPWPEWAIKAKSEGWKEPKGWKPS